MTTRQVSVPPPVDVIGPINQAVGAALKQGTGSVMDGLGNWLFSSLGELTSAVFGFVDKASRPNVMSAWFIDGSNGTGPYRAMATVAATIMGVLVFGGVVQGVVQADISGMIRRMAIHLPAAVIGIGGTVVVVQVLIDLTDAISKYLTGTVGADTQSFVTSIQQVATATGSPGAPMIVLGLLMLVAALVVFVELLVRSLLIYLIVALCPLAWAALVWPSLQGALRKTFELLVAVILSKVVVALAIAVGAAALSATALSGAPSPQLAGYAFAEPGPSISPPTPPGSSPGGLAEGLGLLATGVATLAVAAFSPFLIARLLPFAEAAVVGQGMRGAPVRAGQQAWNMKYQLDVARRFGGRSSPAGGGGGSNPLAGESSSGGSAGGRSAATKAPRAGGGSGASGAGGPASGIGGAGASGGAAGAGASGGAAAAGGASAAAGPVGVVVAAGVAAAKTGKAALGRTQASVASQTQGPSSSGATGSSATPERSGPASTAGGGSSVDRVVNQPKPGPGATP